MSISKLAAIHHSATLTQQALQLFNSRAIHRGVISNLDTSAKIPGATQIDMNLQHLCLNEENVMMLMGLGNIVQF